MQEKGCETVALMSLPTKVRFAHRAAYRAMVLLLALITPILALFLTAVFIPFTFVPYNTEFITGLEKTPESAETMHALKQRMEAIFVLPTLGSLLVTVLILIHICIVFKHGETVFTTVFHSSLYLLWTIGLALWCGFISYDLAKFPNDTMGIVDPLGMAYVHSMRHHLIMDKFDETKGLHRIHQCCGILGLDDFSADIIRTFLGDYATTFPSEYNQTHMAVVPEACCRSGHTKCHLKLKGQEWKRDEMYTRGCLDAVHFPLLAQVKWMTILSATAAVVALVSFVIMLVDVRNYNKRKTTIEKKRSGFIAPQ